MVMGAYRWKIKNHLYKLMSMSGEKAIMQKSPVQTVVHIRAKKQ